MKKVCFVCLGNICRSPMAEFVMKNLTDQLIIESRATSNWEDGRPIHAGTQAIFKKHGLAYDQAKSSQQISTADFENFDYILGMDANNVRDLQAVCPAIYQEKIHQFAAESVPDPWYTGDFDETYRRVLAGCQAWLTEILENEG